MQAPCAHLQIRSFLEHQQHMFTYVISLNRCNEIHCMKRYFGCACVRANERKNWKNREKNVFALRHFKTMSDKICICANCELSSNKKLRWWIKTELRRAELFIRYIYIYWALLSLNLKRWNESKSIAKDTKSAASTCHLCACKSHTCRSTSYRCSDTPRMHSPEPSEGAASKH